MEEIVSPQPESLPKQALRLLSEDRGFKALTEVQRQLFEVFISTEVFLNSPLDLAHRASIALTTVKVVLGNVKVQDPLRACAQRFRSSVEVALRFIERNEDD